MAITSGGSCGTGAQGAITSGSLGAVLTQNLNISDYVIAVTAFNNLTAADGDNSEVTSVDDISNVGANVFSKLGEYTNGTAGVANGVTTSVWGCRIGAFVPSGATAIFAFYSATVADRTLSLWKFLLGYGMTLTKTTGTTNPVVNEVNAANGFGSAAFSGLASLSRLYFRGLGKEANSATQITPSTNFTAITNIRSRNNAAAVGCWGEFRINTSTGETSNPTLAVSGDSAGVFLALQETALPVASLVPTCRRHAMRHMIVR